MLLLLTTSLLTLLLVLLFINITTKYKWITAEEGVNKLYEYSHYLILKIENVQELKKYINYSKFKSYLNTNNGIFLVLHTNSKIIKAERIKIIPEIEFHKSFNHLKKRLKNKDLKISIFNLDNATSSEKDFFLSLIRYKYFEPLKYITTNNLTFLFASIIALMLVFFNILNQSTLHILGIPLQLSLVNSFDFGQFLLYNSLSAGLFSGIFILVLSLFCIGLFILALDFFVYTRKDKWRNSLFDYFSLTLFFITTTSIVFILILFMFFILMSVIKINFSDSVIKYNNVLTTATDYINYTGYPKIGKINGKKSYIVAYDTNSFYFYDLEEANKEFFDFEKKEKDQILYETCKMISEYKDDNSSRLIILLSKNQYIKPQHIKSILKKDTNITDEKPLNYSDIIIHDIDSRCQNYIEKYK